MSNGLPTVVIPAIGTDLELQAEQPETAEPSRNDGSEMPRNVIPVSRKSSFEYCRTADRMPSGMPTKMPMTRAVPVSTSEAQEPAQDLRADRRPVHGPVAQLALEGVRQPADVADGNGWSRP